MRMQEFVPARECGGLCAVPFRYSFHRIAAAALTALGALLALILLLMPASARAQSEIHVSNGAGLSAALQSAKGGETILLAPGAYSINLNVPYGNPWGAYADTVTIRSADPDQPARVSYMALREATNLHMDNLVFSYAPDQSASSVTDLVKASRFTLRDTSNISITNSTFQGALLDRPGNLHDGFGLGNGLQVSGSQNLVIADNHFHDWTRALVVGSTSNVQVTGNLVEGIRSDGFNFAGVQNVLIENNHLRDFASTPDSWDHRDMIQFWTNGTTRPTTDIVIRGNILDSGTGIGSQSIFMRNEAVDSQGGGAAMFYQNILIEDNLIHNAHLHGITVGETVGLTIRNNTLLHNTDAGNSGGVSQPRVNVATRSRDVEVLNNIAHGFTTPPDADRNWTLSNNLTVQRSNPLQANYYDDFFVNARAGSLARIEDFAVLPGSRADIDGIGAIYTRFDPTPETLTARLLAASAVGTYGGFRFDGGLSADADGFLDEDRARFIWDFGDGTVIEGRVADHVFTTWGNNIVTLTVINPDGSTDVVQTRVNVRDPQRLLLETTADGVFDNSRANPARRLNDATIVQDGDYFGVKLTRNEGLSMGRGNIGGVFAVEQFALDLMLKADNGSASNGEIFRIHGNMRLRVGSNGSLTFDLTTANGQQLQMRTAATSILNGDWNALRIVYDGSTGRLLGYVNGEQVGSFTANGPTGLTGPERSWGLTLGQLHNSSGFSGLIGSMGFNALPAELTANQPGTGGDGGAPGGDTRPDPDPSDPGDNPGGDSGGGTGTNPDPTDPPADTPEETDEADAGETEPPLPEPLPVLTCADLGLSRPACTSMDDITDVVLPMIGMVDLADGSAGLITGLNTGLITGPLFPGLSAETLQWGIDPDTGDLWWAYTPMEGDPDLLAFLLGGEGFDLLIDVLVATRIPLGESFGYYWTSAGARVLPGQVTRLAFFTAPAAEAAPDSAPAPVPLPAAGWLMVGALCLLGQTARRRSPPRRGHADPRSRRGQA